jgi:chromosome segregation ATPase
MNTAIKEITSSIGHLKSELKTFGKNIKSQERLTETLAEKDAQLLRQAVEHDAARKNYETAKSDVEQSRRDLKTSAEAHQQTKNDLIAIQTTLKNTIAEKDEALMELRSLECAAKASSNTTVCS